MKRLSLLFALAMLVGAAIASPVDANRAKDFGQKYVWNTLGQKSATLSLAYTEVSDAGTDALYIFNFDHGFVVVSADNRAYPILGYSETETFDVQDIPEGMRYYLGYYARQIQYAIDNDLPVDSDVADQWYLLDKEGVTSRTRMEKAVNPLLSTAWDQGWPYNYYAPACTSYWTNNHCYAGCVATAMSQVMKYWNWPETGVGEHSYNTSSYGGTLSANFGATTYNWAIMPNQLGSQANDAALAVALLMYHCGISVDMNYAPDGSGAYTEDVAPALINYFRYGECGYVDARDSYLKEEWEDLLITQLDRGIPFVYAGSDSNGGHAFNLDGYNNQRYFHFNWGWSGSYNNTYYQIDALNTGNGSFNNNQRAVFNIIPDYIYNAMVPPIETMDVVVADAMTKTAMIRFSVPVQSVSGATLESVDRVVLKRNGQTIHTFNNPQPGQELSYEDNVAEYGCYEYTICGVNYDLEGEWFSKIALYGPNCTWKIVGTTTNFQGWNGGKLQVVGNNGTIFKEVTMTSTSPLSEQFQMPEGDFSLQWHPATSPVSSMTIKLKNSANQNAYSFSGSSTQLSGTLYTGSNDCPNCTPPTDLAGQYHYEDGVYGTLLTWNCDYDPSKYKVYRSDDGIEYTEIAAIENTSKEYFDNVAVGEYYYKVTAYSTTCESTPAIAVDGTDYVYVTVTSVTSHDINARIYPNPANDMLAVEAADINEVVVYDLLGQSVYRFRGVTNALKINTSSLESGIYMINVTTAGGVATRRIIIMH